MGISFRRIIYKLKLVWISTPYLSGIGSDAFENDHLLAKAQYEY
jgi:hypothetical protein